MEPKPVDGNGPVPLFYVGPDLTEGPLPGVLYLALSARESLCTDPFNQPVLPLTNRSIRVFSADLPFHGEGFDSKEALSLWAHRMAQGEDLLSRFILDLQISLRSLLDSEAVTGGVIGGMGLSRGGFLLNRLAATLPEIRPLLCFAPLTEITEGKDFEFLALTPLLRHLNLSGLTGELCGTRQRIYIGNRDLRVGTAACFRWYSSMVETAFTQGIRSPPLELILKPSIGHLGHGTSKESFQEGAAWMASRISP